MLQRRAFSLDANWFSRSIEQMENVLADGFAASRPGTTLDVTRGVVRLFVDLGLSPLLEFQLPNGRRADVVGLDKKGRFICAEVKSCRADFDVDEKWEDYLGFCDEFFFAVAEEFPRDLLPVNEGLIIADGFGAAVVRPPQARVLSGARRKSLTLKFARQAASRACVR